MESVEIFSRALYEGSTRGFYRVSLQWRYKVSIRNISGFIIRAPYEGCIMDF